MARNIKLMIFRNSILIVSIFTLLFINIPLSKAQSSFESPEVSQIFRNIVEITDESSIQIILDDFFITENVEDVERIEIIDISDVGFGSNDILVIYPSRNVYVLDQPSPSLLEDMRTWSITEQRRDGLNTLSADYFYPHHADTLDRSEISETEMELVMGSMISDVIESVNRNYHDMPISMRFERGGLDEGFTFQIWNYNEDAFSFQSRPARADTIAVNDFLYVVFNDSTVVADTTKYDVLYISHSSEKTIYIPPFEEQYIQNDGPLPGHTLFQEGTQASINYRRRD
ncbi:hypothetical protein QLX67_06480 [Balneolaceae bacterium ANBcel3]|nr:hypothetical protein [Balneolaceae bacterium ANBcel3]